MEEAIKLYLLEGKEKFCKTLPSLGVTQEQLIELIGELLYLYANDKNSSTIREIITLSIAGYERNPEKIGYNGVLGRAAMLCDAKPKNIASDSPRKHDGGGNFTDFTYERLERYKSDNINIVVSGFIDGRLIYVLEFPFAYQAFYNRLKNQLDMKFQKGRPLGTFLRSASFTYKEYMDCPELKFHYLNKELLEKHKDFFTVGFYTWLNGYKELKISL